MATQRQFCWFLYLFNLKDITRIREDNSLAGMPKCSSHAWKKNNFKPEDYLGGFVLDEMTIQVRATLLFWKKEVNNVPEVTCDINMFELNFFPGGHRAGHQRRPTPLERFCWSGKDPLWHGSIVRWTIFNNAGYNKIISFWSQLKSEIVVQKVIYMFYKVILDWISNEGLSYFDCIIFFSQILGKINNMVDKYMYIKNE